MKLEDDSSSGDFSSGDSSSDEPSSDGVSDSSGSDNNDISAILATVPNDVYRTYRRLRVPREGIAFLFAPRFSDVLYGAAARVTRAYNTYPVKAIEEFRRLLALKVLTRDYRATKISPTPLSKFVVCFA